MKKRMQMIAKQPHTKKVTLVLLVVIAVSMVGCTFGNAVSEQEKETLSFEAEQLENLFDVNSATSIRTTNGNNGEILEVEEKFIRPVEGTVSHPFNNSGDEHNGIDIAAKKGTSILATADGTVIECGFSTDDGNYLILQHEDDYKSYYMHCEELLVEQGDTVAKGESIATVGATGKATGAHLHFSISLADEYVDINELY